MRVQDFFDLARKYIAAAREDDVALAVREVQEAFFVEPPDVARALPFAAAQLGGGFRLIEIADHQMVARHHDFAFFAVRQNAAFFIGDADFAENHRQSRRAKAAIVARRDRRTDLYGSLIRRD